MNQEIFTPQILECIIQLSPVEYNNSIDETLIEKLKKKKWKENVIVLDM